VDVGEGHAEVLAVEGEEDLARQVVQAAADHVPNAEARAVVPHLMIGGNIRLSHQASPSERCLVGPLCSMDVKQLKARGIPHMIV
jgi:hypothetical protein